MTATETERVEPPAAIKAGMSTAVRGPSAAVSLREQNAAELQRLDLLEHARELDQYGLTVVPPEKVAGTEFVDRVCARVLDLIEEQSGVRPDTETGMTHANTYMPSLYYFVFADPLFEEMLLNPVGLALATYLLGDDCMLSASTVFMKGPADPIEGRRLQLGLHCDNAGWLHPEPYPLQPQACNVTWLLTDYTKENGALAYVPGSHLLCRNPVGLECDDVAIPVEAPRGSMVVWPGNTWHGSFPRTVPGLRLGLAFAFQRPHLAPQQPYAHDVTEEMLERNPPRFAKLMGLHVPTGWRAEGPEWLMITRMGAAAERAKRQAAASGA